MKKFKIALVTIVALTIVSCSNVRHSHFTKIKVEKEVAKVEVKKLTEHEIATLNANSSSTSLLTDTNIAPEPQKLKTIDKPIPQQIHGSKASTKIEAFNKSIHKNFNVIPLINPSKNLGTANKSQDGELSILALVGFICGLLGLVLLISVGFPFGIGTIGLIFSILGLGDVNKKGKTGKGFAIAGLITSIIIILTMWVIIILLMDAFFPG